MGPDQGIKTLLSMDVNKNFAMRTCVVQPHSLALESCAEILPLATALPEILDGGANFDAPSEPREITKQGNFSPTSPVRKGEDSA